jgi:hypothetical protein
MTGISLQPLGVQCEDFVTCDSVHEVCVESSVDQVSDRQVNRTEEESEKEEDKVTFLNALKGLEVVRKYMQESDTDDGITVKCSKHENELCGLRTREKKSATTVIDSLSK